MAGHDMGPGMGMPSLMMPPVFLRGSGSGRDMYDGGPPLPLPPLRRGDVSPPGPHRGGGGGDDWDWEFRGGGGGGFRGQQPPLPPYGGPRGAPPRGGREYMEGGGMGDMDMDMPPLSAGGGGGPSFNADTSNAYLDGGGGGSTGGHASPPPPPPLRGGRGAGSLPGAAGGGMMMLPILGGGGAGAERGYGGQGGGMPPVLEAGADGDRGQAASGGGTAAAPPAKPVDPVVVSGPGWERRGSGAAVGAGSSIQFQC